MAVVAAEAAEVAAPAIMGAESGAAGAAGESGLLSKVGNAAAPGIGQQISKVTSGPVDLISEGFSTLGDVIFGEHRRYQQQLADDRTNRMKDYENKLNMALYHSKTEDDIHKAYAAYDQQLTMEKSRQQHENEMFQKRADISQEQTQYNRGEAAEETKDLKADRDNIRNAFLLAPDPQTRVALAQALMSSYGKPLPGVAQPMSTGKGMSDEAAGAATKHAMTLKGQPFIGKPGSFEWLTNTYMARRPDAKTSFASSDKVIVPPEFRDLFTEEEYEKFPLDKAIKTIYDKLGVK